MPEEAAKSGPPTYYANIVTMVLNVDELAVELRRYLPSHNVQMTDAVADALKPLAPPSLKEVMGLEPIARIVLTYSAAKALRDYLVKAFPPTVELRRKTADG